MRDFFSFLVKQDGGARHDPPQPPPDDSARQSRDAGDSLLRESPVKAEVHEVAFRPLVQTPQRREDLRRVGLRA